MDVSLLKRGERAVIAGCFLFDGADAGVVSRALCDARCGLYTLEKGETLSGRVDYRSCLCLVLAGALRVSKETSSRFLMNVLRRGSVFGAADLYDDGGEPVSILTAAADCRILILPRSLLEELMRAEYRLAENYIRFLTGRIKFLNDTIRGLAADGADRTLACWLLSNAQERGGGHFVRPSGSLSSLAGRLNIGRASLYRAFEKLAGAGVIEKNGREIIIKDIDVLKTKTEV